MPFRKSKRIASSSSWDRVLKYLARRPRSEKEIRDYLGEECTEEIISRLKELKFLNDAEFADWFIEQRSRFRPKSGKMLAWELKRKGIKTEVEVDDTELAKEALNRKMRLWKNLEYPEFKTKAFRFLASRGFSWEIIEKAVKKAYNTRDVS